MQQTKHLMRVILIIFGWIIGQEYLIAQTFSVTQAGEIGLDCSEYQNNLIRVWNIDIPTDKCLMLEYSLNTEECCDKVEIFAILAGKDSLLAVLSGQQQTGTVYSLPKNGQMKVRFTSDGDVNCQSNNTYSGFKIRIAESDLPLVLNTKGEKGIRIENTFGYMDLGPEDEQAVSFSTDRSRFVFTKPLHLQDGKISNYGIAPLALQTNGLTRMSILNSGYVGIGTLQPTATLDVNGRIKAKELEIAGIVQAQDVAIPDLGMKLSEIFIELLQEIASLRDEIQQQEKRIEELEKFK